MPERDYEILKIDSWKENNKLESTFNSNRYKIVGTFRDLPVIEWNGNFNGERHYYVLKVAKTKKLKLIDGKKFNHKIIMDLDLGWKSKNKFYVDFVYLNSKYRGTNFSCDFYRWLIVTQGIEIVSGSSQSAGGESIWQRLSLMDDIKIKLVKYKSVQDGKNVRGKSLKFKPSEKAWDHDKPNKLKSDNYCFLAKLNKKFKKAA